MGAVWQNPEKSKAEHVIFHTVSNKGSNHFHFNTPMYHENKKIIIRTDLYPLDGDIL